LHLAVITTESPDAAFADEGSGKALSRRTQHQIANELKISARCNGASEYIAELFG
jgi:hypothetical protein